MLPHQLNPVLRLSYCLIAPFYDSVIAHALAVPRKRSLAKLPDDRPAEVLISGVGTGLDLPLLPALHRYTALDFNAAMLARARPRAGHLDIALTLGDSMALPYADAAFDHVLLHLILAVVPEPRLCLREAARVLRPGGTIIVFDKFLQPRQNAWLRRALTPLSRRIATRMDVVFEEVLADVPGLSVVSDEALYAHGWFRGIVLKKD